MPHHLTDRVRRLPLSRALGRLRRLLTTLWWRLPLPAAGPLQPSVRRRRRALCAADPLIRPVTAGRSRLCGRVVDRWSAAGAAAEDLALLTGLLEQAAVPCFLVPGEAPERHVLGVEECHRRALLEALADGLRHGCAYAARVEHGTVRRAVLWADGRLPRSLRRAPVLRVGVVRLAPGGRPVPLDPLLTGCEIEFWRRGTDLGGRAGNDRLWLTVPGRQLGEVFDEALAAPRRNRVAEVVPAEAQKPARVRVRGRETTTFPAFAQPRVEEARFPVDVVYTWVDGDDPALAARRSAYRADGCRGTIAGRETGASRYTSHDELRYSLRSLAMYAGFVRHVYLVTDQQVPCWLDRDAPGLTVVDHREILPGSALPVFNSHAIESRLHHIPGLADHYLYFNDDVFLNRPVTAEHFFHGSGLARIPLSPYKIGLGLPRPEEPAPNSAGKNVRELLLRTHGRLICSKCLHTPHPQLRPVIREIERESGAELARTTHSRFRATTDLAPAATLHHHWALLTGRGVPGEYKFRYLDVSRPGLGGRLARLCREDVDFFCLNDVDTPPAARPAIRAAIQRFLTTAYPFPSPYELPATPAHRRTGPSPGSAGSGSAGRNPGEAAGGAGVDWSGP
ncbi:stealth family protein [Streptomyces sp. YIM 98790]|uniref:stealth family protein n=1 Tax=Streptomyces sp. YIM 98790 TaxID=2689077 RepID=UPI00140A67B5|nr:stealth family protein [Streptomyces sp. YIM 98790]